MTVLNLEGDTDDALRADLFARTHPGHDQEQVVSADVQYPDGARETISIDYTADPPVIRPLGSRLDDASAEGR